MGFTAYREHRGVRRSASRSGFGFLRCVRCRGAAREGRLYGALWAVFLGRPIRYGAEAPGCVRRCAVLFWFSAQVRAGRGRSRIVRRPGPPTGPAPAPPPHLAWPIAVATPPITPLLQPLPPTPESLSSGAVGRRGRVGAPRRHWGHEARHRCSRRSGSSSSRRRRRTLYGPAVLPTASTLWRPPLVLPSTLCTSAVQYPPVVWFHTVSTI